MSKSGKLALAIAIGALAGVGIGILYARSGKTTTGRSTPKKSAGQKPKTNINDLRSKSVEALNGLRSALDKLEDLKSGKL